MRARLILFFLLLSAIYHSNLRPVASGDSLPSSLVPLSVVLDGSATLDRFGPWIHENVRYSSAIVYRTGGRWHSTYPVAGAVLVSPLYAPAALVPGVRDLPPASLIAVARIAEKVTAVVLAAISAIALYFLLLRIAMERVAWMLTVVFALGTGTWSTASQALWSHTFGLPAMIGCFYAIERFRARDAGARWYWSAGVFAALALAIRPINASLLAALAAGLIANKAGKTDYIRAFTPPAVAAVALALYNLAIFHSLAGGYSVVASGFAVRSVPEFLRGVAGLLISPGRGLFVYTPVAMFALFAWLPRARTLREEHRPVFTAATTFVCAHIAVVAIWPMWWGGCCWGSRLLTELLPAVIVLIALGWPAMNIRWKRVFAAAAVYGCFIQALGVYFYPKGRWDHLPVSVNDAPARLWDWGDNPIVRTARGGVAWEPYAIAATAAAEGLPAAARKLRQLGINAY